MVWVCRFCVKKSQKSVHAPCEDSKRTTDDCRLPLRLPHGLSVSTIGTVLSKTCEQKGENNENLDVEKKG